MNYKCIIDPTPKSGCFKCVFVCGCGKGGINVIQLEINWQRGNNISLKFPYINHNHLRGLRKALRFPKSYSPTPLNFLLLSFHISRGCSLPSSSCWCWVPTKDVRYYTESYRNRPISAVLSNIVTARIRHGQTKLTKKLTDPVRLELALPNT